VHILNQCQNTAISYYDWKLIETLSEAPALKESSSSSTPFLVQEKLLALKENTCSNASPHTDNYYGILFHFVINCYLASLWL